MGHLGLPGALRGRVPARAARAVRQVPRPRQGDRLLRPPPRHRRRRRRVCDGREWNERHFTKDRTWKGTDHAASLETAGLTKLCRDLKAVHTAMTYKASDILP